MFKFLPIFVFSMGLFGCSSNELKYTFWSYDDTYICDNVDLSSTSSRAISAVISLGFTEVMRNPEKQEALLKEHKLRNLGDCSVAAIAKARCAKSKGNYTECVPKEKRLIEDKKLDNIAKSYSLHTKNNFDLCWGVKNISNQHKNDAYSRESSQRDLGYCNASDMAKIDCKDIYSNIDSKDYKQCVLNTTHSIDNKISTKKIEIVVEQAAENARQAAENARQAERNSYDNMQRQRLEKYFNTDKGKWAY
jgi:hypothetical protein